MDDSGRRASGPAPHAQSPGTARRIRTRRRPGRLTPRAALRTPRLTPSYLAPSKQARVQGLLGVAAVVAGYYVPGALAFKDRYPFVQLSADIVEPDAILGGVPGGKQALGHERPVRLPAGLVIEIVMNAGRAPIFEIYY